MAETGPSRDHVCIELSGLRVEFTGGAGPTQVIVPLVFPVGTYHNVCLRIRPRSDVYLRNEVDAGDAFRSTFTKSHTTTGGGSFFVTASHGRTFGSSDKPFDVVFLEDLRGIRFHLVYFEVQNEPIGLKFAFPIETVGSGKDEDFFADIQLEVNGLVTQEARLPREVHPDAGKVLLVSGLSEQSEFRVFGDFTTRSSTPMRRSTALPKPNIAGLRRRYLHISDLHRPAMADLRSTAKNFHGIHLYTNVEQGQILIGDTYVSAANFFEEVNGLGLKFIFIATCNSVQVFLNSAALISRR